MQSVSHKEFIFPVCLALPQGHLPVQDARNTSPRRRLGAQLKHTISEQLIPSSLCFRTKVTFFSKQIFQASIWQSHEQMEITPSTVIVSWPGHATAVIGCHVMIISRWSMQQQSFFLKVIERAHLTWYCVYFKTRGNY